jgi:tetrahydromethanopterin S-methyltransferase subunit G
MMGFPALVLELYEVFRRKVGADEPPARVVSEAAVIEDARFRSIDKKFDALSHTMDQRFDALSQRFVVLKEPSDGLSRVLDQRFHALNHAMDQRFGTIGPQLSQRLHADIGQRLDAMDERFGTLGREMSQRFDALGRMIDDRFARVDQQFVARESGLRLWRRNSNNRRDGCLA